MWKQPVQGVTRANLTAKRVHKMPPSIEATSGVQKK